MSLSIFVSLFLVAAPSPKVTVAILGSDKDGTNKAITLDVKKLAKEIDPAKVRVIYNGGDAGLRYSFVREFKAKGGEVIAYRVPKERHKTPDNFTSKSLQSDAERLQQIYNDSDVYLVLPGGMETVSEMSYVVDQNAGKENALKPIIVFDAHGYYKRFFQFVEYVEKEGFMDHRRLFRRSVREESTIPRVLSQIYFVYNQKKPKDAPVVKEPS